MKTILVVDDEPKIAALARDYLEHAGYAVVVAGDGPATLALVRSRRPDLIVLDLGLPGLDGLDVARAVRRDSDVPILMLTARTDERTGSPAWSWAPTTTSRSRSARASSSRASGPSSGARSLRRCRLTRPSGPSTWSSTRRACVPRSRDGRWT